MKKNMIRHLTLEELRTNLEDGDILIGDVIEVMDTPESKDYTPEKVKQPHLAMA